MNLRPLVSIVVPIYNVPGIFLRKCIESCTNQTLKDIEVILIDDGSISACGEICDEYASKDSRVKVIHKKNGGLVSARNAGYYAVSGLWHMYLDGDDWIDEETCEELMEKLKFYPDVDVVFWNCVQELGDHSIKGKWGWKCKEDEFLYQNDENRELARNVLIYKSGIATAYSKLIRTSYAHQYNIKHDDRLKQGMEGTEYSFRTFYHATKTLFLKKYYNHYRYNPLSISKSIDEKNTQYIMDCLYVIDDDISKIAQKTAYERALYQRTVYAVIAIAMNTYFHPNNPDKTIVAVKKFAKTIKINKICQTAIRETSICDIDIQRGVVLFLLKIRLYIMLKPVAILKQKMLKKGYYNY